MDNPTNPSASGPSAVQKSSLLSHAMIEAYVQ